MENRRSQYHGHEVSSGRQPAAMRDLCSVSGGMNQGAVLLDGHLDRETEQQVHQHIDHKFGPNTSPKSGLSPFRFRRKLVLEKIRG